MLKKLEKKQNIPGKGRIVVVKKHERKFTLFYHRKNIFGACKIVKLFCTVAKNTIG